MTRIFNAGCADHTTGVGFTALWQGREAIGQTGWVTLFDGSHLNNWDPIGNANWRLLEGGIVQAVSLTLMEQVVFDRREITSRDWSGYPILRFSDFPSIEIVLMDRSDPSLGAGEGSLPPTSAALANAFAHATGRRLRALPMTPERVKASLS